MAEILQVKYRWLCYSLISCIINAGFSVLCSLNMSRIYTVSIKTNSWITKVKQQSSEIVIQFKNVPHKLFYNTSSMMFANRLVISLQPEETIKLLLNGKSPGRGMNLQPIVLNLDADTRSKKIERPNRHSRSRRLRLQARFALNVN